MDLSYRAKKIEPSATLAIGAKAKSMIKEGIDVISLAAGEPDWDPPYEAKEAAITAVREGNAHYTPASGLIELRDLVAEKMGAENKVSATRDNVIITHGAKYGLYLALQCLINPDDEVLLPSPYWVSYLEQIKLAGGVPRIIETSEDEGFKLDLDTLEDKITSRVKGIILNYPSNPTGVTYTESELRYIGEVAVKKDIFIISDEIYEYFNYDQEHISIASLSPKIAEKVITINGFSKAYAIPGWRVGYAVANADIIKAMGSYQSHSASNPNTIAQLACIAGMKDGKKFVAKMAQEFLERRDSFVDALNNIHGVRCQKPAGAFYVFPNVQYYLGNEVGGVVPTNSIEFATALLEKARISCVPGSAFGAEGYVRLSYTQSVSRLKEAIQRLNSVLENNK
jgi:aspartate aminotransferase